MLPVLSLLLLLHTWFTAPKKSLHLIHESNPSYSFEIQSQYLLLPNERHIAYRGKSMGFRTF